MKFKKTGKFVPNSFMLHARMRAKQFAIYVDLRGLNGRNVYVHAGTGEFLEVTGA